MKRFLIVLILVMVPGAVNGATLQFDGKAADGSISGGVYIAINADTSEPELEYYITGLIVNNSNAVNINISHVAWIPLWDGLKSLSSSLSGGKFLAMLEWESACSGYVMSYVSFPGASVASNTLGGTAEFDVIGGADCASMIPRTSFTLLFK